MERMRTISTFIGICVVSFFTQAGFSQAGDRVDNEDLPAPYVEDPSQLRCRPKELVTGDTLVISLGPAHGSELMITRSADNWSAFLAVEAPPREDVVLMTATEFRNANRVEIPTSLVVQPWHAGEKAEPVFKLPGEYVLQTSVNLESEHGGYECRVMFKGAER